MSKKRWEPGYVSITDENGTWTPPAPVIEAGINWAPPIMTKAMLLDQAGAGPVATLVKSERKVERVSELPDGAGPVTACTMFNGMLLAATENGMYQLVGSEWRRLEFAPKGEGD